MLCGALFGSVELVGVVREPIGGGLQLKPSCPSVRPTIAVDRLADGTTTQARPSSSDFYHAQSNASRVDIPAYLTRTMGSEESTIVLRSWCAASPASPSALRAVDESFVVRS